MADDSLARPNTFATWLHATVPMPDAIGARLLALEGRQPTLDEMRRALGFGLDLGGAWPATEAALPDFGEPQGDGALAALLDAVYGSLRGDRVVRLRIGRSGEMTAARDAGTIALREGERLALLVVATNAAGDGELWAEARGDGCSRMLPAARTAAMLLDAGAMPAGSYLLPVMLGAGGRVTTLDVPVACAPAGRLSVRIVDDESGERIAARVYCSDDRGAVAPDGGVLRRDRHGNAWRHVDGGFAATIAGQARVRVVRGIEYEPAEATVAVPADGEASVELRLRRWSHMAADGWRSGDVHTHLHYGGELALTAADAGLAQRAEDVHVLQMMVANCLDGGRILDRAFFEGRPHELSDAEHILTWGEEYRNNLYGHLCLSGIASLVEPICSGVPFTSHPHDAPANAVLASDARAARGTVSYAHPVLYDGIELDRIFAGGRNVEAKELPVDAALGHIDAVDVMSYPGKDLDAAALWYRLLNCGLRLAATAGTDTFMNTDDASELLAVPNGADFSSPPAGARAFVRIDGAFSMAGWCDGVGRGETFVTNGPMLDLSVNGSGIGAELRLRRGDAVRVRAAAGSHVAMESIELVVDGAVAATCEATLDGRFAEFSHQFVAGTSCWIALRARGARDELVLGDALFAHTSPVYVIVDDEPIARAEDAAYFVDWIERLIALTAGEGRFASAAQRDEVLALFREGQAYYRGIAGR
ncbi:MAG: CehA/McbA family metallohydrolase [Dehalococcoidia bacterium]|nr:CehA/McbA family metallohydrolase [Dehalococcoidia bacterium]